MRLLSHSMHSRKNISHSINESGLIIYLARHGETRWNVEGRMQGWENSELTATGKQHALRHGEILNQEGVKRIFASDLGRVRETVEGIQQSCDAKVTHFQQLRERNVGSWEGEQFWDLRDRYPEAWKQWENRDEEFAPPEGESLSQMKQRVRQVLPLLVNAATDPVAFVSHGITTLVLIDLLIGLSLEQKQRLRIPHDVIHRIDRSKTPSSIGYLKHDAPFTQGINLRHSW